VFAVRHYSVTEIAAMWNLSDEAVRGIFANEPGVLVLGDPKPRGRKRRYTTLRIPEFVVSRFGRLTGASQAWLCQNALLSPLATVPQ
jgi:hypothetical protein